MKGYKFSFPKKGGGKIELFGVHYDNVKAEPGVPETPADIFEDKTPTVSVAADAGSKAVKGALEKFLREQQASKGKG